jgi:hypothetical protein
VTPELEAEIDRIVDRKCKRILQASSLTYEFLRDQFAEALGEITVAAMKSPPSVDSMERAAKAAREFQDRGCKPKDSGSA